MNRKFLKCLSSFVLIFLMTFSISFASTNYRFLTDEEINAYTKFEIDDYNRDNLQNTRIVDASEKIYDFADLLSDADEAELFEAVKMYNEVTNFDCYVVTLADEHASDYDDEVFADDFYDYNDFGIGQTRDGIGILVDIRNDVDGNRYVYVTTTGNGILYYDDSRIDDLTYEFVDEAGFNYGYEINYKNGILAMINMASEFYSKGIPGSNKDAWIDEYGNYYYEAGHARSLMSLPEKIMDSFGICFVIAAIAGLIFFFCNKGALGNKKIASSAKLYLVDNSIHYSRREDAFLTTHTTSYRISSDSSSGGGSSSHHSSSGGSHGGGGRHF